MPSRGFVTPFPKASEPHERLRSILAEAVAATTADGILLSGGLDTSVVAAAAAMQGRHLRAVSISVKDAPALDEPFARQVATRLGWEHQIARPTLRELLEQMPRVIGLLRTFDPMELRNSVVTYAGLEAACAAGISGVLTGDAADELFAGYSYMFNMPAEELPAYVAYLDKVMHFSSLPIGSALGLRVELPYLHEAVRGFALTLQAADLVGERDGQRFGKKILREAFSGFLPAEIIWRVKTPIEFGSGSTALAGLATEIVGEAQFQEACQRILQEDGVRLRDKEQYLYYCMFRKLFPAPRELPPAAKSCPHCNGPVARQDMRFCRICGAYPI